MGGIHGSGMATLSTIDTKLLSGVATTGLLFQENINGINSIRIQAANAGVNNIVTVYGTVNGIDWMPVGTLAGNNTALFSVQAFTSVKAECTFFDSQTFDLSYKLEPHPSAVSLLDKDGVPYSPANPVPVEGDIILSEGGLKSPSILNVNATTATEYAIVIPTNTKEFLVKMRTAVGFRMAWAAGDTATNYTTIHSGASYTRINLKLPAPLVIYIMPMYPTVIEIQTWL